MSIEMEVPLQSEITEWLVNARHWLLCMGANLTGDMCWGFREPQSYWRNMPITNSICYVVCSVPFSLSVMSDSLPPHGLHHNRACSSSPTPGAWANSCPSSRWLHPTISSSVILFSSCLQAFPVTGSFLVSQFFTLGGQSIGVSASASVLPMNIQDWFPLGWTVWISLLSRGFSRLFSSNTIRKHPFLSTQPSLWFNSHICTWLLENP